MKLLPLASSFAFAAALAPFAFAQEPAPATPRPAVRFGNATAPKPADKPVYDEAADAKQVVAAAVAKAKRENQRVLIQWGANWCGWCKWLAGTMKTDRDVSHKLLYEYVVVHVDVGHFDKNMDLAKSLGAEFKAIPYLTVLDGDGKALVQQNTEPFEVNEGEKHGHDPAKLLAFLTTYQPAPLVAKDVLADAMATAAKAHKRVFLHFGAPWCGWCHRLEDWMARPEIAALLAKDFVDVKIDNDRMTGAKEIYDAQLAGAGVKATGIPWFVFLDETGKLLANSDGPKGNVGFPYQPEEVAHFGTMLQQARHNLSDDDITALLDSLNANRMADEAKKKAQPQTQPKVDAGNGGG